ncbi:hypothetical protein HNR46_001451 [Haloferula luteola]|uniref:Ice-binding protein C-terminal domain-containing protein n=1 Tax=Haloferula luteola TaxID=595692 RepID=A0A840UYJ7_9BACT|nr:PEP-CTERM sorting domain-containing protein [Haloferula luteola]MBB5351217.1 hypothetical protein [Haloferula luteola]
MNSRLTPFRPLRRIVIPSIAAALALPSAQAAWALLDNFDSYALGETSAATSGTWNTEVTDSSASTIIATDQGNSLQTLGGFTWSGAERNLTGTDAAITVGEIKTFYWQVKASYTSNGAGWDYDFMMGLSPDVSNIDTTDAWQDFAVMPYVNNDATTPYINADAPGTFWAAMTPDVWYNVWVVVNNDATDPTYALYMSTGTDAAVLVTGDANWRNFSGNLDLNAIGFMAGGNAGTQLTVDNIYYSDGTLLTVPVPEPSIALLSGLGVLGLIRRQRR